MLGHRHPRVETRCAGSSGTPSVSSQARSHEDVVPRKADACRTLVRTSQKARTLRRTAKTVGTTDGEKVMSGVSDGSDG